MVKTNLQRHAPELKSEGAAHNKMAYLDTIYIRPSSSGKRSKRKYMTGDFSSINPYNMTSMLYENNYNGHSNFHNKSKCTTN
jgi:hypothetical protein